MTHSQKLYQHLVRALMVAPMLSSVALGACDDTDYTNTGEQDASNNDTDTNDDTDDDMDRVTNPDPIACQEALESGVWTYDEGCGDGTWDLSHEAVAAMVGDDTCVNADNIQGEAPCYQSFFLQTWPEWLRDVSNIENNGLYLYYVGSEEGTCTYAFSLDTCVAIGRALRMEEDFTTCEAPTPT